jgi:hypothetical protein
MAQALVTVKRKAPLSILFANIILFVKEKDTIACTFFILWICKARASLSAST